ncbi:MAG: twin-arginine translocation pathway signal protein [Candidatus Eremiobacteraeota bacterium]|nr:twin-arginine translocation pathway signal protein [Candidatus Eremiobacteraeota bacterium]
MLRALGAAALLAGPGSAAARAADANTPCRPTAEGEIGPFFVDDSAAAFNRSSIVANLDGSSPQAGVPLRLSIVVRDARKRCAPVAGSQVDIWHCNALGMYSGEGVESTTGQTWLRGYQISDRSGMVRFSTIVPGWYPGRTTHIHLRVRSSYSAASSTSDGSNTTQVFFPQDLIDALHARVAPYSTRGAASRTTNARDFVYTAQTKGTTLLALAGGADRGYTATFAVDLPIT